MSDQVVADPIKTALEPFDSSPTGFTEAAVGDALRAVRDSVPEPLRRRWWAESAAARFREVKEGDSVWGTAFGPMAVLKNELGEEVYSPDVKDADATTLDYWIRRSKEAKHPILRARYADLAWDLAAAITKCRPSVDNARLAIDSYIAASKLEYRSAIHPIGYLCRALHLALSISDAARTKNVVNEMFVLYSRVAKASQAGTFPFLFDSLYGNKKVTLSEEQTDKIISGLEDILRLSTSIGTADFNPGSAEGAAARLATHFRKLNEIDHVRRVWRAYGMSLEDAAKQASPMLALGWLHPVLEIYQREGLLVDADRINQFISSNQEKLSKEFKPMSADFSVPADRLREYVDALTDGGLNRALGMIAGRFLAQSGLAREVLERGAKDAPLQALFPIRKIRDGHVVATIGSVEDDPEGRLIHQLAQNIEIGNFFLHATIESCANGTTLAQRISQPGSANRACSSDAKNWSSKASMPLFREIT